MRARYSTTIIKDLIASSVAVLRYFIDSTPQVSNQPAPVPAMDWNCRIIEEGDMLPMLNLD